MNNEYVHWILGAFKKRALHLAHALAFSLPLINKTTLSGPSAATSRAKLVKLLADAPFNLLCTKRSLKRLCCWTKSTPYIAIVRTELVCSLDTSMDYFFRKLCFHSSEILLRHGLATLHICISESDCSIYTKLFLISLLPQLLLAIEIKALFEYYCKYYCCKLPWYIVPFVW